MKFKLACASHLTLKRYTKKMKTGKYIGAWCNKCKKKGAKAHKKWLEKRNNG